MARITCDAVAGESPVLDAAEKWRAWQDLVKKPRTGFLHDRREPGG